VLILDNLSCLFSGLKENDADGWENVLPWLLELRRRRVAIVFVAHAGRNGFMRGTSRREDAAFWILQLIPSEKSEEEAGGARFVARFDKNRNAIGEDCPPVELTFRRGENGAAEVLWEVVGGLEKLRFWIEKGFTSATDIAREMEVTVSRVSALAKIAMKQGWLGKNPKHSRQYELVKRSPASGGVSSGSGEPFAKSDGLSEDDADEVLATFPKSKAK
jgi:hypothetical protein